MTGEHRKPAVVGVMHLIRPLFHGWGHDISGHSDGELADALLKTCPHPTEFWLSDEHIRQTLQSLKASRREEP